MTNGLMMQYFLNDSKGGEESFWTLVAKDAAALKKNGVTSVLLPPAFKGAAGDADNGYNVYDLYDLGEFSQKGSVATKYGTKEEYIAAIKTLQSKGINVYADLVMARKLGADSVEKVPAAEFNAYSPFQMVDGNKKIGAFTGFEFPGRGDKYSDFKWSWKHFKGIDWDERLRIEQGKKTFKYTGSEITDAETKEALKYDYLIGGDVDLMNQEVYEELVRWGKWYIEETGVDGIRLDGAKDMPVPFVRDWLYKVVTEGSSEVFALTDYWDWNILNLTEYLEKIYASSALYDVPLHLNFYDCSKAHGNYDLRRIFDGTVVRSNPVKAVTFVDNSESVTGGIHESFVEDWFKASAYAMILLRNDGYPCVFSGDYNGIADEKIKSKKTVLDRLMKLRKTKAYGVMHDYIDDPNCIGWTREGDEEHKDSGLAVVISDGTGGTKHMYIGKQFAGAHFSDVMGNAKYNIKIDEEGCGDFYVNRDSVSVWVRKEK